MEPLSFTSANNSFQKYPVDFIRSLSKNGEVVTICGGLSFIYTRLAFDDEITDSNFLKYRATPYRIQISPRTAKAHAFAEKMFKKSVNVAMFLSKERSGKGWVGMGQDGVYVGSIDQWTNSLIQALQVDVKHSGRFTVEEQEAIKKFNLYDPKSWGVHAVQENFKVSEALTPKQLEAIESGIVPKELYHFHSVGLLAEKFGYMSKAVQTYQSVLSVIPDGASKPFQAYQAISSIFPTR